MTAIYLLIISIVVLAAGLILSTVQMFREFKKIEQENK